MSYFSQNLPEKAKRTIITLFSFLPLSKTFQIIRYSKNIQNMLDISLNHYKIYNFIIDLVPSLKINFNLKYFEKCEQLIRKNFPDVQPEAITNLFFRILVDQFYLICTSIKPDLILSDDNGSGVQWITYGEEKRNLISCSKETIKIWDLNNYECIKVIRHEQHSKFLKAIYSLKNNNYLVSISYDMKVVLWSLQEKTSEILFDEKELVCSLLQLKNRKLVLGCEDSAIKIYNFYSKSMEDKLEGSSGAIRCMCELDDGKLATGGLFAEINIWNLSNKSIEAILSGHNGTIQVLIQLSTGELVSGSGDWTIKIWDMEENEEKKTLYGHKDVLRGLIEKKGISNQLISVSEDNVIKLWNIETGSIIFSLIHCHQDILFSCLCLPDGRVVSCSQDSKIKFWNIDSIFEDFKKNEYLIKFAKKKENDNSTYNSTSNNHINIKSILQPGNKMLEHFKREYEYLPFAVINEQCASN